MKIKYKTITIVTKKTKFPKIFSGNYEIGEIHGDYVAFTDQKEMEFSFNDIINLSVAWKLYKDKNGDDYDE